MSGVTAIGDLFPELSMSTTIQKSQPSIKEHYNQPYQRQQYQYQTHQPYQIQQQYQVQQCTCETCKQSQRETAYSITGGYTNYDSLTRRSNANTRHQKNTNNVSCLHVMEHTSNCPICSKLYKPDNTLYLVIIFILIVAIIILGKKSFDI